MEKRVYSKPKIMRVRLNPEQAVLSQCSASATDFKDGDASGFCEGGRGMGMGRGGCRQDRAGMMGRAGRGADSGASS